MARSLSLACGAVLLALATAASVGGQSRSMPPPPAALFGTSPSDVSGAEQITDSLSVAGVESGTSTALQPVQQAFLASVTGNSSIVEGSQTVSGHITCDAVPRRYRQNARMKDSNMIAQSVQHGGTRPNFSEPTDSALPMTIALLSFLRSPALADSPGRPRPARTLRSCRRRQSPSWSRTARCRSARSPCSWARPSTPPTAASPPCSTSSTPTGNLMSSIQSSTQELQCPIGSRFVHLERRHTRYAVISTLAAARRRRPPTCSFVR